MTNILAVVGRPNVGKSTLFNRLTQSRAAIVDSTSGVTRDRHYGKSDWNGKRFSVIDTGGYIVGSDDVFEQEIRKQVRLALDEANAILFVVDAQQGLTPMDEEVAVLLRKAKKPVFVAVNKVDSSVHESLAAEFYSLGLGGPYTISAMNGSGTGDLLDAIVKTFPEEENPAESETDFEEDDEGEIKEKSIPKFAIVGRPNVGKSSFVNALLGEERNIVTDVAGTTRDSVNALYNKFGHEFYLVDTAGLRKKNRVDEDLEFYSVMRSIRAIENADVCILLLDATQGIEAQDINIFHLIEKNNKGALVLVNKWDLLEKETNTLRDFEKAIKKKLEPFTDIPVIFISVLEKQRIFKAVETAVKVYENKTRRIATRTLNELMLPLIEATPPPALKGKHIKIKYCTQLPTFTPKFAFFANLPQYVKEPYKRFLENKLRENFDFSGVPIEIYIRKK